MVPPDFDIVVIGGGPAGSLTAVLTARAGYSVGLIEKHPFPRETLCGEFLSVEVISILRDLGLDKEFFSLGPSPISRFTLCTIDGSRISRPLGFTAFGMKRGTFDQMLLDAAASRGVTIIQPAEVESVIAEAASFTVRYRIGNETVGIRATWVIGAYGRSSRLDTGLGRSFARKRTGLNGVKFHLPATSLTDLDPQEILLCMGRSMYCGINHVGAGTATLCFLEQRSENDAPPRERIRECTEANAGFSRTVTPHALSLIESVPIYGSGNIYFGQRCVVERGVLMVGDAAGVIAPLAGDGIGMALQGAVLIAQILSNERSAPVGREAVEVRYREEWQRLFRARMRNALRFQRVLLSATGQRLTSALVRSFPALLDLAVRRTRDRSLW